MISEQFPINETIDNITALSCRRILGQLKRLAVRCKDLQTSRSCITVPLLSLAFVVSNPGTHVLLRALESRQDIRVKLEKSRVAVAPEDVFVKACRYGSSDHRDYSSRWVPDDGLLSLWAKQSIDWSWVLTFMYHVIQNSDFAHKVYTCSESICFSRLVRHWLCTCHLTNLTAYIASAIGGHCQWKLEASVMYTGWSSCSLDCCT